MEIIPSILIPISLTAVAIVLGIGLWNMMRGGSPNVSQKMMRFRVVFQLIAIAVIMGTVFISNFG